MLVTYLFGEGRDGIGDPDTAIRTADVQTLDELIRLRAEHLGDADGCGAEYAPKPHADGPEFDQ